MTDRRSSSQEPAFSHALAEVVTPRTRVLDLGGDVGHRAVTACRLGAAGVWSVQSDRFASIVREVARANGYADRIHVIRNVGPIEVGSDLPFDVVLGPLPFRAPIQSRGLLAGEGRSWQSGTRIMPRRESLHIAVVQAAPEHARHDAVWRETGLPWSLEPAARRTRQQWSECRLAPEALVTAPAHWADIDYERAEMPVLHGAMEWTATQSGPAHGLVVWSEVTLVDDVTIDFAPGTAVAGEQAFFPWPHPVALCAGDRIVATMRADALRRAETWTWTTRIFSADSTGHARIQFNQSTFFAESASRAALEKCDATHVPSLTVEGEIDRAILTMLNAGSTMQEVAGDIAVRFPDRWMRQDALERVRALARRYGRPVPA